MLRDCSGDEFGKFGVAGVVPRINKTEDPGASGGDVISSLGGLREVEAFEPDLPFLVKTDLTSQVTEEEKLSLGRAEVVLGGMRHDRARGLGMQSEHPFTKKWAVSYGENCIAEQSL